MRGRVLEDGLIHLNKLGSNLRRRIIVQYVNSAGSAESGLDAGGLFKEFWTDLSNQSFDPNWALFRETEGAYKCFIHINNFSSTKTYLNILQKVTSIPTRAPKRLMVLRV